VSWRPGTGPAPSGFYLPVEPEVLPSARVTAPRAEPPGLVHQPAPSPGRRAVNGRSETAGPDKKVAGV